MKLLGPFLFHGKYISLINQPISLLISFVLKVSMQYLDNVSRNSFVQMPISRANHPKGATKGLIVTGLVFCGSFSYACCGFVADEPQRSFSPE